MFGFIVASSARLASSVRFLSGPAASAPAIAPSTRRLLVGGALLAGSGLGYLFTSAVDADSTPGPALSPAEWRAFELRERRALTHDTSFYRFALPQEDQELGLGVASCLMVRGQDGTENPAAKPYTPVSAEHQKGFVDLIVKTYPGGKVSGQFDALTPGSRVEMKGPFKKIDIQANQYERITFVVGGTGITPAYQILKKLLADPSDKTKIKLIYANKTEADVILAQELVALQKEFPHRLDIHFVITRPVLPNLTREYITKELLQKELPPATLASQKVFVCGTLPFYAAISGTKAPDFSQGELTGYLQELGYSSEQVFKL